MQHAPFPAAIQDGAAVYTHILRQYERDVDPSPGPSEGPSVSVTPVIDDHLATIRALPRKPIVTNALMNGTSRGLLALALFQHGRMGEFYGVDVERENMVENEKLWR